MARTQGARNVVHLADRTVLTTVSRDDVDHLPELGSPRSEVEYLLTDQSNFRSWLHRRNSLLADLAAATTSGATTKKLKGPRPGTTRKYGWYLSQMLSLELLTGFEVFFKTTVSQLADALGPALDPTKFGDEELNLGAFLPLPGAARPTFGELLCQRRLFHRVAELQDVLRKLVDDAWLGGGRLSTSDQRLRKGLGLAFQIRHTLAHNRGLVTANDAARFRRLGITATADQYIDTVGDGLYVALREFVEEAVGAFYTWCMAATASYLARAVRARRIMLVAEQRTAIETLFGQDPAFAALPWPT